MATTGASEGGFSGRAGFVLRFEISRIQIVNGTTNRWRVSLRAINRSGYTSYDLSARPFSVGGTFGASGSWVPDFRNGDNLLIWTDDVNVGTDSNGNSSPNWSASAGPAGIFGSASTSGSITANRIPQVPDTPARGVWHTEDTTPTSVVIGLPAPSDDGGSGILDYLLQIGNNSSFSSLKGQRTVAPANRGEQTIPDLSPNTTYYFRHRARNSVGSSGWSSTLTFSTDPDKPSAPRNLDTSNQGPSGMTLTWDAPADDGGASISGYRIQRATNSAFTAGLTEFNQTARSKAFTDLLPSTQYWFRVLAKNSAGSGPWSSVLTDYTISGAYVSNGSAWRGAGVFVSNGSTWQPATIAVSDGASWEDAV